MPINSSNRFFIFIFSTRNNKLYITSRGCSTRTSYQTPPPQTWSLPHLHVTASKPMGRGGGSEPPRARCQTQERQGLAKANSRPPERRSRVHPWGPPDAPRPATEAARACAWAVAVDASGGVLGPPLRPGRIGKGSECCHLSSGWLRLPTSGRGRA